MNKRVRRAERDTIELSDKERALRLAVVDALPDPAFILTESGRYAAIIGGADRDLYHDGSCLVDFSLHDVLPAALAEWFLAEIRRTLQADRLRIVEYTLAGADVNGIDASVGPREPIHYEGRVQPMDIRVDGERAVIWVARNNSQRHHLEARLRALSETDALTGICNRRRLMQVLGDQLADYDAHSPAITLLIIDIDHFKPINDRYGHLDGDRILTDLVARCQAELAGQGLLARLGGEEFALVLAGSTLQQAFDIAETLRLAVAEQCFDLDCGAVVPVTISIGGSMAAPHRRRLNDLLRDADQALYDAKNRGRNRVVMRCADPCCASCEPW